MPGVDFSQIRQLVRSVLRSAEAGATPAALPQRPDGTAAPAPPARPAQSGPQPLVAATKTTDPVRLSPQAQQQLADSVLRVLAQAVHAATSPGGASSTSTPTRASSGEIATATINTVLSDPGLRAELVRVFSQPQVESRIADFLRDPVLQEVTVRLLAHPEMADVAQEVFLSAKNAPATAQLLSQSNTQAPMTHILAQSGMERAVAQTVALPDGAREAVSGLLRSPEGRAVVARALGGSSDTRAQVLQVLAELTNAAQAAPSQGTRSVSWSVRSGPSLPQSVVALLERADVQSRASDLLSDARTAPLLLRVLNQASAVPASPEPLARAMSQTPGAVAAAQAIRVGFEVQTPSSEPALPEAAVRFLARKEVQALVPRLLQEPATRAATLQVLGAAQATNSSAVEAVLTRPDVQAQLPASLADPTMQSTVLRMLGKPELTESAREVLSQPQSVEALNRTFVAAAPSYTPAASTPRPPTGTSPSPVPTEQSPRPALPREPVTPPPRAPTARDLRPASTGSPAASENEAPLPSSPSDSRVRDAQSVARSLSAALEVLSHADMAEVTRRVFASSPQTTTALAKFLDDSLARTVNAPSAASASGTTESAQPGVRSGTGAGYPQPAVGGPQSTTPTAARSSAASAPSSTLSAQSSPTLPPPPSPDVANALRMLAQTTMTDAARQVLTQILAAPDAARAVSQWLAHAETRSSLLDILARPEMAQVAERVFAQPETAEALASAVRTGRNPAPIIRLLSSTPQQAATLLEVLSRPENVEQTAPRYLAREEALTQAAKLLQQSETRTAFFDLLSRPELATTTRVILERSDVRTALSQLLQAPESRLAVLQLLEQPGLRNASQLLLARPEMGELLRGIVESTGQSVGQSAGQPVRQSDSQTSSLPVSQSVSQPVRQADGQSAGQSTRQPVVPGATNRPQPPVPSPQSVVRTGAAADRSQSPAPASPPQPSAQSSALSTQSFPAALSAGAQSAERAAALALLARANLSEAVRQALQAPGGLAALVESVRTPPEPGATFAAAQEASLFHLLARPEMASMAQDILHRPDISAQIPRLLVQPETRGAALELLTRPDMEDVVRVVFAGNTGRQLAVELMRAPALQNLMAQFLQQPEMSRAMIAGLSLAQNRDVAVQFFAQPEAQRQAAALLAPQPSSGSPEEAGARALQRDLLALLARPDMTATATRILSQPGIEGHLAELLRAPQTQANTLALLGRAQLATLTRPILMQPAVSEALADILAPKSVGQVSNQPVGQSASRPVNHLAGSPVGLVGSAGRGGQGGLAQPATLTETGVRSPQSSVSNPQSVIAGSQSSVLSPRSPALSTQHSISSAQSSLLELLSRRDMTPVARVVLSRGDVQAEAARFLQDPETRAMLWHILSQPETSAPASRIAAQPAVQQQLAELLTTPARQPAFDPEVSSVRAETLRFLARPENAEAAQAVFGQADVRAQALEMLATPESRTALLALLTRPEMGETASAVLGEPRATEALTRVLTGPSGPSVAGQMLSSPNTAAILLRTLSSPTLTAAAPALLSRDGVQAQLAQLLSDPTARKAVLTVLAQPEMREIGPEILLRSEASGQLADWVRAPETRSSTLTILAQSSSEVRSEISPLLRLVFETPGTIEALRQLFTSSADGSISGAQAGRSAAVRLLAWPEMADVAQQVFNSPESRQVLAQMLVQTAEALQVWQGSVLSAGTSALSQPTPNMDAILRLLARPDMAATAQQVFAVPETRAALAELLAPPSAPVRDGAGSQILGLLAETEAILRILSRPELADAAREIFARVDVQARAAQFLFQGETRPAMLEILSSPIMEAITGRILERREARIALVQASLSPSAEPRVARLLSNPAVAEVLLDALARPENQTATLRLLGREDVQAQLLRLAQAPQMRSSIATALTQSNARDAVMALLSLAARTPETTPQTLQSLQAVLVALEARSAGASSALAAWGASAMDHEAVRSAGIGLPSPAAPQVAPAPAAPQFGSLVVARLRQAFGPNGKYPIAWDALDRLERVLERLSNVSPARARQALRTLPVLGELGATNLEPVLRQVAGRLENMATQLAQKGGLPQGLREPILDASSLLMMRVEDASSERLSHIVRTLAQRGVEVAFVGRDSSGAAQIHIQTAEMPLSSAERARAPQPSQMVMLSGLSRDEAASVRSLLPDRQVTADLTSGLRPDGALQTFLNPLAALFAWSPVGPLPDVSRRKTRLDGEDGEAIPSMLDLVRMEPLLLTYEPGELMIPGTDVPLILPPGWEDD
jgi:hypothetical protein